MNYYQQFTLLPDPEFVETVLMNALMSKLHRALHDIGNGEVGVSFPNANKTLGSMLRLHGTLEALTCLDNSTWYKGMRDHCEISSIDAVPEITQWRKVSRRQPKVTASKLRRNIKLGRCSEVQAQTLWAESEDKYLKGPFTQLKSCSSGQVFRLYIEQSEHDSAVRGSFNRYGLSGEATIPWF